MVNKLKEKGRDFKESNFLKNMKKLLVGILLAGMMLMAASPVLAQTEVPTSCTMRATLPPSFLDLGCPTQGEPCPYALDDVPCGVCCVLSAVVYITNWIFTVLIFLVVILVLVGAYFILTAAGNAEKVNKGRQYITYAAIGLAVALLARAVPQLVGFLVIGQTVQ